MIVTCLQQDWRIICYGQTSKTTLEDHMSPATKVSAQSYNIIVWKEPVSFVATSRISAAKIVVHWS